MDINGRTRLVGLVGHPLDHTLSPAIHNAAFEALGLNYAYVPIDIVPADFSEVIEALGRIGFVGYNVTMPFKEEILNHLDEVASFAQIAGAVNAVQVRDSRLVGYNTDGRGLFAALERDAGFEAQGAEVVMIGAGGAAAAAVLSLALAGAKSIAIVNRTPDRAERLAERMAHRFRATAVTVASPLEDLEPLMARATLVVNATSVGMRGSPGIPIRTELLGPDQLVVDMVYDPPTTELLEAASAAGAKVMNGLPMLVYQAANAFEIWTESNAPVEIMRSAAEKAIANLATQTGPLEVEV